MREEKGRSFLKRVVIVKGIKGTVVVFPLHPTFRGPSCWGCHAHSRNWLHFNTYTVTCTLTLATPLPPSNYLYTQRNLAPLSHIHSYTLIYATLLPPSSFLYSQRNLAPLSHIHIFHLHSHINNPLQPSNFRQLICT